MTKNIVVFGGTGQQGSAFVRALGKLNIPTQFTIYLLSRRPDVGSLADVPGVTVVPVAQNYMNEPELALKATKLETGEVYGVFFVNGYVHEKEEVAQGIAIVKAAEDYKVKHIIYASVSHDDSVLSLNDGFDAKRKIERLIKSSSMKWTMLRDTDFMDNWVSERWMLKAYRTMLLRRTFYKHPERKIVMVSTKDIGRAAAMALVEDKWENKEMKLAGDALDIEEIQRIYKEVMGEPIAETYAFMGTVVKWAEPSLAQLSTYYDEVGYSISPKDTKEFMETENFREFMERYKREHVAL